MRSNMEDTPNSIMERTMESDPHALYARVRNQEKIQEVETPKQRILRYIGETPSVSLSEITKGSGVSRNAVHHHTLNLASSGYIWAYKSGKFVHHYLKGAYD